MKAGQSMSELMDAIEAIRALLSRGAESNEFVPFVGLSPHSTARCAHPCSMSERVYIGQLGITQIFRC
jgi:hypothetical protein